MKRIHLFEFEDFSWFPNFLRVCMTRYLNTLHRLLNTKKDLSELIDKTLTKSNQNNVIDLCSGSGGPMIDTIKELRKNENYKNIKLTLTDLYPNNKAAKSINVSEDNIEYLTTSVDATHLNIPEAGLRTMICSMHHMKPQQAKAILKDAKDNNQPICVYEVSDNSYPKWIWWTAFPINIISTLLLTPLVRPMSLQQIVFTYIIPVLPIVIAWDGAVSNARTYNLNDLDILTEDLKSDNYTWEKGTLKGKGGNKLYLLGYPN